MRTMTDVRESLRLTTGASATYYSLPQLEKRGISNVARLPVSLRIILEAVLRNHDGHRIRDEDAETLARWEPNAARTAEVPFVVGRVLLQDFTGVPLLVDLAAMRGAVARRGHDVGRVQPLVPVDLVIDHSVQVDYFGRVEALQLNSEQEFRRNEERYRFLKWGAQAFDGLRIGGVGHGAGLDVDVAVALLFSQVQAAGGGGHNGQAQQHCAACGPFDPAFHGGSLFFDCIPERRILDSEKRFAAPVRASSDRFW